MLWAVPTIYVLSRNVKKKSEFLSENFQFLVVKCSIYLNRRVFVMSTRKSEPTNVSTWLQYADRDVKPHPNTIHTSVFYIYMYICIYCIFFSFFKIHTLFLCKPLFIWLTLFSQCKLCTLLSNGACLVFSEYRDICFLHVEILGYFEF